MLFTNNRANNNKTSTQKINFITTIQALPLPKEIIQKQQIIPVQNKEGPKLLWGPAIWYLFHTMAEKVKESSFNIIRDDLIRVVRKVCSNLPCPSCTTHAVQYLNKVDMSKIQTKEDLKQMLYIFHNDVNKRTGKPEYSYNDLNQKYPKGKLREIITVFFRYFEDKHKSVHMLSNDMYTMRVSKELREWFTRNIHHFDA